jgi:hypothetical protein
MGGPRKQYHSATERIEAELRQEFHLHDMAVRDCRVLLRMLDGRIPVDAAEVEQRKQVRAMLERLAKPGGRS